MVDFYKDLSLESARKLQEEWQTQLKFDVPDHQKIQTIAGADVSYNKHSTEMFGAIVLLTYPDLDVVTYALARGETTFPYITGYLGFREVPTLLKAWELIPIKPDVLVLDGQGILHPRRMGIASHFGIIADQATIGCAKSSLYGNHGELSSIKLTVQEVFSKTSSAPMGYALITKNATKPVYVSPGYGISLPNSLQIIKNCIRRHRIPEPTRLAHLLVNEFRLGKLTEGFHTVTHLKL